MAEEDPYIQLRAQIGSLQEHIFGGWRCRHDGGMPQQISHNFERFIVARQRPLISMNSEGEEGGNQFIFR